MKEIKKFTVGTKAKRTGRSLPSLSSETTLSQEASRSASTVANVLSKKLYDSILHGELGVGSSLPSERELMATYQCSRTTVREALRNLRAQGLIEVRRGRIGGSFVSGPSAESVIRSLDQMLRGRNFLYGDLVAAREAIEPAAAAQAAIRCTPEKLEALRQRCLECEGNIDDREAFERANLNWHIALAEASDNSLFVAFLTSISKEIHAATEFEEFDMKIRKAVIGIHWQIFEAIFRNDPEAARRRTARHLSAYAEELAKIK